MEEYKTVIIGSGIAGMTAGIYLRRAGIETLVIENNMPGGTLNNIYKVENYPGYNNVNGTDLALNIYNQFQEYNPKYLYEDIKNVDLEEKVIITSSKKIKYHYLIIATGRKSRGLNISNEDSYIGHGISFCASCDGALYKDKTVVVVGGANTAVTDALYLADICKKVYIIYRKDDLRAEDILKKRVGLKSNIEILYNKNITKYLTDSENITGVLLDDGTKIDTSCVFLAIGALPNSELFDVTKNNGYIEVDNSYQTSALDVYACGDVIDKKVYQLVTASADGIVVANSIIEKEVKERK